MFSFLLGFNLVANLSLLFFVDITSPDSPYTKSPKAREELWVRVVNQNSGCVYVIQLFESTGLGLHPRSTKLFVIFVRWLVCER